MINKKFDFKKTELEEGIAELERDLEKSEGHDTIKTEYIRKLLGYMKKMSTLMVTEATQEQRAELEYLSECSACVSREMASVLTKIPVKEVMIKSAETMGITVGKKNGILVVNLPMILPTKAKTKAGYLFDPIFYAMQNASEQESFLLKEKAMMCIEFIYDRSNKKIPRGDHDNKEVKQVIDAIANFVVPDDSIDYQFPYMKKYFRKRSDVEHYQIISENIYGTEAT